LQELLGVSAVEEVISVEQTAEAFTYRDAVRFANGQEILLQRLQCGQRVDVLSLSGREEETEHRKREEESRQLFIG
jgi:hypothetical protein